MKILISNRTVIEIVLATWIIVTSLYLIRTPLYERSYDGREHMVYTEIIVKEKRLPKPYDAWEAWQPPLYYLINSFICPKLLEKERTIHFNYIRALSVFYGAIVLLVLYWFIKKASNNSTVHLLVLLFIATTPMFVVIFSTYNNDSLAVLLSIAVLAISYKLNSHWSWTLGLLLFAIGTAAVYTKYTAVAAIICTIIICSRNLLRLKMPSINERKIIVILATSLFLLTPWLVLHNYHHTKELIPNNSKRLYSPLSYKAKNIKLIDVFSPATIFQNLENKWKDPWVHIFPNKATKAYDFWSCYFVSSVLSAFEFQTPAAGFAWITLLIHLLVYFAALKQIFKSNLARLSSAIIILGSLFQILMVVTFPYTCTLEYRYTCWSWVGWALLYTYALISDQTSSRKLLHRLLLLGIIVHICILLTISESRV